MRGSEMKHVEHAGSRGIGKRCATRKDLSIARPFGIELDRGQKMLPTRILTVRDRCASGRGVPDSQCEGSQCCSTRWRGPTWKRTVLIDLATRPRVGQFARYEIDGNRPFKRMMGTR